MKTDENGIVALTLDEVIAVLGSLARQTDTAQFIPFMMMSLEAHCSAHNIEVKDLVSLMSELAEMDNVIRNKYNIDTFTKSGVDEFLGMPEEDRQTLLDDVFEDVFGKDNEDD